MYTSIKTIMLAGAVAVSASAASAALLTANDLDAMNSLDIGTGHSVLIQRQLGVSPEGGAESVTYTFTATENLRVLDLISIGALGFTDGDDLDNLTFGVNESTSNVLTNIVTNGATTEGDATLSGFVLGEGESFTFTFDYAGGATAIGTQLNFATAAVPVPAAGLLLLTALAGAGAVARRKKSA